MCEVSIVARVFPIKLHSSYLLLKCSREDDLKLIVKLLTLISVNLFTTYFVFFSYWDESEFQFNVTCLQHKRSLHIKFITGLHLLNPRLVTFALEVVCIALSCVLYSFVILDSHSSQKLFDALSNSKEPIAFLLLSCLFSVINHSSTFTPHFVALRKR